MPDHHDDTEPFDIDELTAERLVRGVVDPDEAPAGYAPVVRLLTSATGPVQGHEIANEAAALAGFREATATPTRPTRRSRLAVGLAAAAGALLISTGVAAAAGVMPGGLQSVAHDALGRVGISVPDGGGDDIAESTDDDESDTSTTTPESSSSTTTTSAATDPSEVCAPASDGTCADNHGAAVCAVASDGTCQNPKGETVCTIASDGRCHAGNPPGQSGATPPSNPGQGDEHRPSTTTTTTEVDETETAPTTERRRGKPDDTPDKDKGKEKEDS